MIIVCDSLFTMGMAACRPFGMLFKSLIAHPAQRADGRA